MSVLLISMRVCQGCKFVEAPKAGRITRARNQREGYHFLLSILYAYLLAIFLGPRGPLVVPSILPSRPVHPSAPIFPEFIDEL